MYKIVYFSIFFAASCYCRVAIIEGKNTETLISGLITKESNGSKPELKVVGDKENSKQKHITIVAPPGMCVEITQNSLDPVKLKPCPPVKVDNSPALILTPYIEENRVKEARRASKVNSTLFLGVESYSGFLTVNKTYNSNSFFWYFPVVNKPVNETPWIIWLQGGPGASSMTGIFDEIGPFKVYNNSLKRNPYTWIQNHSVVFIDNPIGTGFSFTNSFDGLVTNMATYGNHLYSALKQFLQLFPELRTAPLYVAGESYAGKYVPALGMEIHKHKEMLDVNFKGLIIGNAYVDPDMISHLPHVFKYFGLMDEEQLALVKPLVDSFNDDIAANRSVDAKNRWTSLISLFLFMTHQKHGYNFLRDDLLVGKYSGFLERSDIRKAIHVGNIKFSFVNFTVNRFMAPDFLSSSKPLFETLLDHYKVLTYCGQLDQMLPCVSTSANYRTWRWNSYKEFHNASRFPYIFNNKLAGYHKTGGRLTEVVVRGAGHMVPLDTPAAAQYLVARWTHDQPLSKRYGMLEGSYLQEFVRNNSLLYYI